MVRRVCTNTTIRNISGSLEEKRLKAALYAKSKWREVANRYSVNHGKTEWHIVCFKCNRPDHMSEMHNYE